MKIIISPSKTQSPNYEKKFEDKELLFPKKHKKVLAMLRKHTKASLRNGMKIKDDLLHNTYKNIKNYNKLEEFQAFYGFTGLVFFNMDRNSYSVEDLKYIEENVRILDAFYGVLEPGTLIKPYRLDMKMQLGINLYKHWDISEYFKDELIINLASDEFSKMIDKDMITVSFFQDKTGKHVNQPTYAKMARGRFVDFMVKNKITSVEEVKTFNLDGYCLNEDLSSVSNLIFTRKKQQ